MPYTIEDHRHRLAAWAAGRAASVNGRRFKVRVAVQLLEVAGFNPALASPDGLPSPGSIDVQHRKWRKRIIRAARQRHLRVSHGVAAKLINCYLKVRFVCAGHHRHERVKCLHPPIDRLLLNELKRENVGGFANKWREFNDPGSGWSSFDSDTYESVIEHIREAIPGEPLWKIEKYWRGYQ